MKSVIISIHSQVTNALPACSNIYVSNARSLITFSASAFRRPVLHNSIILRSLTIQEFILAFGIFKNIMCDGFPNRSMELDVYQREIIGMSAKFGGTSFNEYHKAFSARAAELLTHYNVKVDWSRRDNNLFCSIFAGHKANACSICNSIAHTT